MKRKYSDETILQILGEAKTAAKVQDTCQKYGISERYLTLPFIIWSDEQAVQSPWFFEEKIV